jgi:prepilin-type N-terminal cleavage/methylation domain-containing protein
MYKAGRRSGGLGRKRWERGFSFAELLVTVSMAGILLAVGALSLGSLSTAFSLDGGSRAIAMAFSQARVFAISRARTVTVTFGSSEFTVRDTQLNKELLHGSVPKPVTLVSSGVATFSPLGTVASPVVVTLDRNGETRLVRVGFTGEVEIE